MSNNNGLVRVRMMTRGAGPKGAWQPLDLRWASAGDAEELLKSRSAEVVELPPVNRDSVNKFPLPESRGLQSGGRRDWENLTNTAMKAIRKPGVILETGTAAGNSTRALLNVAIKTGSWLYSVDSRAKKNHGIKLQDNPHLTVVTDDSVKWIINYQGKLALAFLDSNHGKAHVLAELRALKGKVRTVAIHDVHNPNYGPGIKDALEEFGYEWEEFHGECGIAVVDMTKERESVPA